MKAVFLIEILANVLQIKKTEIYYLHTVPVKSLYIPTHLMFFLNILLFSTLWNNSEDIKTMK